MNTIQKTLLIGAILVLSQCLYAQRFSIDAVTNIKSVSNTSGYGKCIDIAGGYVYDGNAIVQYDCHDTANQQFRVERVGLSPSKYYVTSVMDPSKCIGIQPGVNGNPYELIRVETCKNSSGAINPNVTWLLDLNAAYQTRFQAFLRANDGSATCIDIPSGSAANSLWLQLYTCHDGPNQRWISV